MEQDARKSCWGVTIWTVAAVGVALALVLLFNDVDAAQNTVAAAN